MLSEFLLSALFAFGGFLVVNMPLDFLQGHELVKDNPAEIRMRLRLRAVVGYPMLIGGSILALFFLVITIIGLLFS